MWSSSELCAGFGRRWVAVPILSFERPINGKSIVGPGVQISSIVERSSDSTGGHPLLVEITNQKTEYMKLPCGCTH